MLGNDFVGEGPALSPSFLMDYLFRLCGWKGSAWMQYTDSVMSQLPVLTSNGFYVSWDGAFTTAPDPEQAKIISDFRIADFWYRRHFLYEELTK